jgi:hypothetical protein
MREDQKRRYVGRNADGESGKDDVEADGESELKPGQQKRIKVHETSRFWNFPAEDALP